MLIQAVHKLTTFGQADEVFNLGPPLHAQVDNVMDNTGVFHQTMIQCSTIDNQQPITTPRLG